MIRHIWSQTIRGKTVNRMLMNDSLRAVSLRGRVLDLGSGTIRSSYFDFLRHEDVTEVVTVDISSHRRPDIIADLEEPLPIQDAQYDRVLCFNLLEHVFHHEALLKEIVRVLRPGGALVGYVPFLVKVHPDPHDYFRYTAESLTRIMKHSGFETVDVRPIGRGPFTAAWAQCERLFPRVLRFPLTLIAFGIDTVALKFRPGFRDAYPLGYRFIAQK